MHSRNEILESSQFSYHAAFGGENTGHRPAAFFLREDSVDIFVTCAFDRRFQLHMRLKLRIDTRERTDISNRNA